MDFQNSPPLERLACFYVTISENFEHFHCFNFKTDFLEKENYSKKTRVTFLVESTKTENASSAISEVNVKANRTYNKRRKFGSKYFFLRILFQSNDLL